MPDPTPSIDIDTSNATVPAPVYVYEAPIRLWHWTTAVVFFVLCITGFLIGDPVWPQFIGQPYYHFLMGDIRLVHFVSGYILALALLVRIYWAVVGNQYSREIFLPKLWSQAWRQQFVKTIRWYFLIESESGREIGHNSLAQVSMFIMFVFGVIFEIVTGFALYGEASGYGSWSYVLFSRWVVPFFGSGQAVHTWHRLGMWYLVIFVIVHVYMVIREDIMSRQTMLSTMINGWRYFKNDRQ